MLGKPVTVRIAHATITAPGGCISYQDIEIQGTPGDVDRALGAIFRSGVARLEAALAPVAGLPLPLGPAPLVDPEALRLAALAVSQAVGS